MYNKVDYGTNMRVKEMDFSDHGIQKKVLLTSMKGNYFYDTDAQGGDTAWCVIPKCGNFARRS